MNTRYWREAGTSGTRPPDDAEVWHRVVANGAKFTADLLWSHGDFNADGFVDGQDFILWNGNNSLAPMVVPAVPGAIFRCNRWLNCSVGINVGQ